MLLLSPFEPEQKRVTAVAEVRDHFADHVFVAHAAPESRPLAFCQQIQSWGIPRYDEWDVLGAQ